MTDQRLTCNALSMRAKIKTNSIVSFAPDFKTRLETDAAQVRTCACHAPSSEACACSKQLSVKFLCVLTSHPPLLARFKFDCPVNWRPIHQAVVSEKYSLADPA